MQDAHNGVRSIDITADQPPRRSSVCGGIDCICKFRAIIPIFESVTVKQKLILNDAYDFVIFRICPTIRGSSHDAVNGVKEDEMRTFRKQSIPCIDQCNPTVDLGVE